MKNNEALRFHPVRLQAMRLTLKDLSPENLEKSLPAWANFFQGEKVLLDLKNAILPSEMDWNRLQTLFKAAEIEMLGVCGVDEKTALQIKNANLFIFDLESVGKESCAPLTKTESPEKSPVFAGVTRLVEAPVRSGVEIFHPNDIVVLGRVNAGAQILSNGNIFICGALKGKALAGGANNKSARIFTASMQAELVSIAGVFQKFENGVDAKYFGKPVCVYLESEGNLERLKIELL